MNRFLLKKLQNKRIWKRILYERLTAPLHLNFISFFVYFLGSYKLKIDFDLILRQQHAYGLLKAAERAKKAGYKKVTIIEFGVANGVGLINIEKIAKKIESILSIEFKIIGFDTGKGMPPAIDYRDHPDIYAEGDFPMNFDALKTILSPKTILTLGEISETSDTFINNLSEDEPIGFVSIDVDYYSSTKDVLKVFTNKQKKYLEIVEIYMDDINHEKHNSFCGELLAIHEFNQENKFRKIEHHSFLENSRIFKHADWIKHMYQLHVLDNDNRSNVNRTSQTVNSLSNPYYS